MIFIFIDFGTSEPTFNFLSKTNNVLRKDTDKENDEEKKKDEIRVYLELEKDISKAKLNKKKEIIRQPSTIYIHYAESIGLYC